MITLEEAAVYLAHALAANKRTDHGALVVLKSGSIVAAAVDTNTTEFDSRSALVNVMQAGVKALDKEKKTWFSASTLLPTVREMGMASMQGIKKIFYLKRDGLYVREELSRGDWAAGHPFAEANPTNPANFPTIDRFFEKATSERLKLAKDWFDALTAPADGTVEKRLISSFTTKVNAAVPARADTPDLDLPDLSQNPPAGGRIRDDSIGKVAESARHQLFMRMAWAIVAASYFQEGGPPRPNGFPGGHNIGSVLRGPDDEILGWGINTRNAHSTFHGEVNLIQNYHKRKRGAEIPADSILYSTLEPCYMCAGMFAASGKNLKCFYGQKDLGITNNALKLGAFGSSEDFLQTRLSGYLEFKYQRSQTPFRLELLHPDELRGRLRSVIVIFRDNSATRELTIQIFDDGGQEIFHATESEIDPSKSKQRNALVSVLKGFPSERFSLTDGKRKQILENVSTIANLRSIPITDFLADDLYKGFITAGLALYFEAATAPLPQPDDTGGPPLAPAGSPNREIWLAGFRILQHINKAGVDKAWADHPNNFKID